MTCHSVCWPAAAVSTGSVALAAACWQAAQIPMSPPPGAGTTRTAGASRHASHRCPGRGGGAGGPGTSRTSAMPRGKRRRVRGVPASGSAPGLPITCRSLIRPPPLVLPRQGAWCHAVTGGRGASGCPGAVAASPAPRAPWEGREPAAYATSGPASPAPGGLPATRTLRRDTGVAPRHLPLDNPASRRNNSDNVRLSSQAMSPRAPWRVLMTVHGLHREASIEIQTSPEAVYDLVSDLPRMGEWSPENIGGGWQGGGSGEVGGRDIGHNRTAGRRGSRACIAT